MMSHTRGILGLLVGVILLFAWGSGVTRGRLNSEREHPLLLSRSEMKQLLGGAGCNFSIPIPTTCGIMGQGGQQSCYTNSIVCTNVTVGTTNYCAKVSLMGNTRCMNVSPEKKNCELTTTGQCGTMYLNVVGPMTDCSQPGNCPSPGAACGQPFVSGHQSTCP